jgi:pimeloyl-ACP methyl ester carboxylesterase
MKLFFRESGQGQPLIILHGLFGSSDNWFTLAKTFAESFRVYLIDQRNHGQSPHSDQFNYKLLTEDFHEFILEHQLKDAIVIGHSMGGKTAMNFAVKYPERLQKLIIVDIAPKYYAVHHDSILHGLVNMPLSQLRSRNEAEVFLTEYVPDVAERQFLLKNLVRKSEGDFAWKMNVTAISHHIKEVGQPLQYEGKFDKPCLFIEGAKSNYFKAGDEAEIIKVFTQANFVKLDTGHWVQAEKPAEFAQAVLSFLNSDQ